MKQANRPTGEQASSPAGKRGISRRELLWAMPVFAAGVGAASCGYALAGRGSFLPDYIKTIGIPTFTNRTTVFNLETLLTQKVRSEFIGRGKYQIVPEATGVDALLTGEVTSIRRRAPVERRTSW